MSNNNAKINQPVWIGITIGVFFAGLTIGITPGMVEQSTVDANIARFDKLDFVSFNDQDWDVFEEIHHEDVLVGWGDGTQTTGIEKHTTDVKKFFVFAPDIRITAHPITFGHNEWTVGTGVVSGTFTEPMPLPDGTFVAPTDKHFEFTMVTIAHWQDGQIIEEYLFWDNADVNKQMGIT